MAGSLTKALVKVGENLYIHYRYRKHKTVLMGILTDGIGQPIPGIKNAQRNIRPPESPDTAAEIVKKRLLDRYQEISSPRKCDVDSHPYTTALDEFRSRFGSFEEQMRHLNWEGWAVSTFRGTYTYFRYQILPRLDALGPEPGREDIRAMQEELVARIVQGKERAEALDALSLAQIRQNLLYKMRRCDVLYQQLRLLLPQGALPELDLRMAGAAVPDVEQCKSLPDTVRVCFAGILRQQMEMPYGGVALCLAFMLLCGLRTSESAALTFGDVDASGDTWIVRVEKQLDGTKVTPVLKTQSSYRRLPLVQLLQDMVSARKAYLQAMGFGGEDVLDALPISCRPGAPRQFIPSNQISAAGRALLLASGCSVSYWERVRDLTAGEMDLCHEGEKLQDITAYALRRDFASRAANLCGITARELDLALGHKVRCSALEKRAFYGTHSLTVFRQKLERYVFEPAHTADPAFAPIAVGGPQELALFPAAQAKLVFQKDTIIRLRILSLDAGQSVQARFSDGRVLSVKQLPVEDPPAERHARPLLSAPRGLAWYQRQLAAASSQETRRAVEQIWKEVFGDGKTI